MSDIDDLRVQAQSFQTVALDSYDTLSADESLAPLLALEVDNRQERQNPRRLHQVYGFTQAYEWHDEPILGQSLDRQAWIVPLKGYSAGEAYDEINLGRPDQLVTVEELVGLLPGALIRKRASILMQVWRANATTADGQAFFDDGHVIPAGQGSYSNILRPEWKDVFQPTEQEASDFLDLVSSRLSTNQHAQAQVTSTQALKDGLHIFVHNETHERIFEKVRMKARIVNAQGDLEENAWQNGFTVWRDHYPTPGQENFLEATRIVPGGPRPMILVTDRDPYLDVDDKTNRWGAGFVGIILKTIFGVKAGSPQQTIQGRPQPLLQALVA